MGPIPFHGPNISKLFNKGHIHHHIEESVQILNANTFHDSDDDTSNNDFDIEDLHTAKPMKKGLQKYFSSGHVQKILDSAM